MSEIRALEQYCAKVRRGGDACPFEGAVTQLRRNARYCKYINELQD